MIIKADEALKGLKVLEARTVKGAVQGVGAAMLQLRSDVIMVAPTAPIKEGFLRGSISVHVEGEPIALPTGEGENAEHRVTGSIGGVEEGKITGVIGLNVPYASRTHEVPMTFSEPSAGNKYLESKMANFKKMYKRIIARRIQEVLKGTES